MITKPMRGELCRDEDLYKIIYPVACSPKLDGLRCVKQGKALSKTFKSIPNVHTQTLVSSCIDGLDGELMIPDKSFNEVQSLLMRREGEPDFRYHVFDYVHEGNLDEPYIERMARLGALSLPEFCIKVPIQIVHDREELLAYERAMLDAGYEGIMGRSLGGPYKCGQATLKQGYLFKRKPFEDSEAEVIGFVELMHNTNEATIDEVGHTKRSSAKAGKVPANTLGKFLVREVGNTPWKGAEFEIGTGEGLTFELRKQIWDNQGIYLGAIINYRYQRYGMKDVPRLPIFWGFRHPDDISKD